MNNALYTTTVTAVLLAATAASADPTPTPISQVACLRKIALDLTNSGPSDDDLAALASGTPLSTFVDKYLASPAFAQVMFDVFRGMLPPTAKVPGNADKEEPARIVRHLVVDNADYRDMVSGNYTVDASFKVVPAKGTASGILTTQTYLSAYTGIEYRNWSGQVLKGLAGIVLTPVSEIPPGTDASRGGLANNPACAGCHTSPLYGVDHVASFHDCYDDQGLAVAGCTPGSTTFLGQTGSTITDLGQILAQSVEWRAQAIQSFHRMFWGRGIGKNETSLYRDEEKAFLEAGYQPQALIKKIVLSSTYCAR